MKEKHVRKPSNTPPSTGSLNSFLLWKKKERLTSWTRVFPNRPITTDCLRWHSKTGSCSGRLEKKGNHSRDSFLSTSVLHVGRLQHGSFQPEATNHNRSLVLTLKDSFLFINRLEKKGRTIMLTDSIALSYQLMQIDLRCWPTGETCHRKCIIDGGHNPLTLKQIKPLFFFLSMNQSQSKPRSWDFSNKYLLPFLNVS